ncbi:hypothetical protein FV230_28895, partial [Methylobacterium sp. WL6]
MPPRHPPRPTAAFRAAVALVSGAAAASAAEPLRVGNAVLEPVAIAALPGWQADETAAAFEASAGPAPRPAPIRRRQPASPGRRPTSP